jgi:hypothetical protein
MQVLSQNVKSRLIVLSSLCKMFNNIKKEDPKIDYFLAPFVFLGEDNPNHIQHEFIKYLDKQKLNLNETLLEDGTYLRSFLLENGNIDYTFIYAYKIWKKPNFHSIKFEAFDGKAADKEADKLLFNYLAKKMRVA